MSIFNHKSSFQVKPRICVCVTIYNESRKDLEESLDGLLENLSIFKKELKIHNHEMVVVVVFDGIDRMRTSKDKDLSV
jgi:chitin synthase